MEGSPRQLDQPVVDREGGVGRDDFLVRPRRASRSRARRRPWPRRRSSRAPPTDRRCTPRPTRSERELRVRHGPIEDRDAVVPRGRLVEAGRRPRGLVRVGDLERETDGGHATAAREASWKARAARRILSLQGAVGVEAVEELLADGPSPARARCAPGAIGGSTRTASSSTERAPRQTGRRRPGS